MKIKNILLGLMASALSVGAVIALTNKESVTKVEATSSTQISGLYKRVDDPATQLNNNDQIVFISTNGYSIDDIWGNPGFIHASNTGIKLTNDLVFADLNSSIATVFTVEKNGENNFSFKGRLKATGQNFGNPLYLTAYMDEGSEKQFSNIAYFYGGDRTAFRTNKTDDCSWRFIVDTDEILKLESISRGGYFQYTNQYMDRFCRGGGTEINVYKLVESAYNVTVATNPTRDTAYDVNENIDLSGLTVEYRSESDDYTFSFNSNRELFSYTKKAYGNGTVNLEVTFLRKAFVVQIEVNTPVYKATRIRFPLNDYRGEVMIIDSEFNGLRYGDGFTKQVMGSIDDDYTAMISKGSLDEYLYYVEKEYVNDSYVYHLRNSENKYLSFNGGSLSLVTSPKPNFFVEFVDGGAKIKSDGKYLHYDVNHSPTLYLDTNSDGAMELFKCEVSSIAQDEVDNYVEEFISMTSVCDPTGVENYITDSIWSELKEDFISLGVTAQGIFANTTYEHNNEDIDSKENVIDRYDYIVAKYDFENFMLKENIPEIQNLTPINNVVINSSTNIALVVTVSIIASFAIAMYVFISVKKKNQ